MDTKNNSEKQTKQMKIICHRHNKFSNIIMYYTEVKIFYLGTMNFILG